MSDKRETFAPKDDGESSGPREVMLASTRTEPVPPDVYEDLLNRYEQALVFAGQLQEKNRQQLLLQEKNERLEGKLENLKQQLAVEESYVRLLENALRALKILKD
jgi:hypothetical protein